MLFFNYKNLHSEFCNIVIYFVDISKKIFLYIHIIITSKSKAKSILYFYFTRLLFKISVFFNIYLIYTHIILNKIYELNVNILKYYQQKKFNSWSYYLFLLYL